MIFNMSPEEWHAVLDVHLKGHFNTIKPASILMRQQRYGRIINFTSTSGLIGNAGQANYGAAKAGIAGLTRVVAKDLGRYGVTCNAIAPGAATRMTAERLRPGARAAQPAPASRPAARRPLPGDRPAVARPGDASRRWSRSSPATSPGTSTARSSTSPAARSPRATTRCRCGGIYKPGMWTLDELDEMVPTRLHGRHRRTRRRRPPTSTSPAGPLPAEEKA